jgi:hypothetical protein
VRATGASSRGVAVATRQKGERAPCVRLRFESGVAGLRSSLPVASVALARTLARLTPLEDVDEPDFARNAYEQGSRWCTSFSDVTSEGENGWLADENLLPLRQDELDHARFELGRGSVPLWQVLDALFARAVTRAIYGGAR